MNSSIPSRNEKVEILSSRTPDEERNAVLRISQFVINRRTDNIRREVYEFMVQTVLAKDKKREAFTRDQIEENIKKEFLVKISPILLQETLKNLVDSRAVLEVSAGKEKYYMLTGDAKDKLSLIFSKFNEIQNAAFRQVVQDVRSLYGYLSEVQVSSVKMNFFNILAKIFGRYGVRFARMIIEEKTFLQPVFSLKEIVNDNLLAEKDREFAKAQSTVFEKVLSNPSSEMGKFLFAIAQSYYLIEILNLDPECKKIEETDLSKMTLYIDTNVLIHALTGFPTLRTAIDELLKITASLGIKLRITERTKEEFLSNLEETGQYISSAHPLSQQAIPKVIDALPSGFYRDFLTVKKDNPSLTWEGYEMRMKNFLLVLKNQYSIELEDVDRHTVISDPSFNEVVSAVQEAEPTKSDRVVEHDAFHILLVRHKRAGQRGGILGPPCWFLTNDRSLDLAETALLPGNLLPSAVTTETWLKILYPLMSAETASKDAVEIFSGIFPSMITPATLGVDQQDLLAVQGPWLDDRDLTAEDIKEILGSAYVKSFIKPIRKELEKEGTLFRMKEEQPKIYAAIKPVVERRKEDKKLRKALEKEIEDRRKMRKILFGLGSLSFLTGLYQLLTNIMMGILPLIIGIVLISIALKVKRVKVPGIIEVEQ
jgi:predicted nucleic acid-binding protein